MPTLRFWRAALVTFAMATAMLTAADAQDAAPFSLEGKTIRILVAQPPGSSRDLESRLLAQYLGRYLPGNPTFVVQNLDGAAGLRMLQYATQLDPLTDLTILSLPSGLPFRVRTGETQGLFDPLTANWLGSIRGSAIVCVMSLAKVNSVQDMIGRDLNVASTNASGQAVAIYRMLNRTLGMHLNIISGYDGTPLQVLALQRGEVDGLCNNYVSYREMRPAVDDGTARMAFYMDNAPRDDIDAPYLFDQPFDPDALDLLKRALAAISYNGPFSIPAGADPAFVALIQTAFDAAVVDPEFIAAVEALGLDYHYRSGADIAAAVAELFATPDEIVAELNALMAE